MSRGPRYAAHAFAWTAAWSPADLGLLDHARELGLDALEVPLVDLEAIDPDAIRERARRAGVDVVTSTILGAETDPTSDDPATRDAAIAHLVACVDAAAAMGATVLGGVTYGPHLVARDAPPTRRHLERSAEALAVAARHAAPRGVTVAIEPVNRYESSLVNTAAQGAELADLTGEANVALHLDTYHMNIEERDMAEAFRRFADRIVHVHLTESHRGVPGTGRVDWAGVIGALADAGYDGYLGLEAFSHRSPLAAATFTWRELGPPSDDLVREGLAFVRGLMAPRLSAPSG